MPASVPPGRVRLFASNAEPSGSIVCAVPFFCYVLSLFWSNKTCKWTCEGKEKRGDFGVGRQQWLMEVMKCHHREWKSSTDWGAHRIQKKMSTKTLFFTIMLSRKNVIPQYIFFFFKMQFEQKGWNNHRYSTTEKQPSSCSVCSWFRSPH